MTTEMTRGLKVKTREWETLACDLNTHDSRSEASNQWTESDNSRSQMTREFNINDPRVYDPRVKQDWLAS